MSAVRMALVIALLGFAGGVQAQTTIRGRVIGPQGDGLRDTRVLLHRVAGMSGANVAEAQSDSSGRFTMQVAHDTTEAIYFLAARYEGELYIGEAFQPPFATSEYILSVGVPGTSASALIGEGQAGTPLPPSGTPASMPGGAPVTNTRWLLFAIPAIMLLGVLAYYLLRSRTRIPERRRLLADIAALDLAHAGSNDPDALRAYHEQRAALITQVRAAGE